MLFRSVAPALATIPAAAASRFAPRAATRLVDTRKGIGTELAVLQAGCTLVVRPPVPAGTTAVVLNVTAIKPAAAGAVLAYPCGARRPASQSLDSVAGRSVTTMVIARLGAGGAVCMYSSTPTDLVVDLNGTFQPTSGQAFHAVTPVQIGRAHV